MLCTALQSAICSVLFAFLDCDLQSEWYSIESIAKHWSLRYGSNAILRFVTLYIESLYFGHCRIPSPIPNESKSIPIIPIMSLMSLLR